MFATVHIGARYLTDRTLARPGTRKDAMRNKHGARKISARILLLGVTLLTAFLAGAGLPTAASSAQTLSVGAYVSGSTVSALDSFETMVGQKQQYLLYYTDWGSAFDANLANSLVSRGTTPYITWEPWGMDLDTINSGAKDSYIRSYADAMKQIPGSILLRPMHEMNGDWYPWGVSGDNTPAEYVAAFRHIVDIFRAQGATNVKFVWSPHNEGPPNWDASTIPSYFPGESYFDYAAIDGYNFGTSQSWSSWRSFSKIFSESYGVVTGLTTKPIMIGETASAEVGGDKAAWIQDTFTQMKTNFPQISVFVWFHTNKETDWRVNSSAASLAAYQEAMAGLDASSGGTTDGSGGTDTTTPPAPTVTMALTSPTSSSLLAGSVNVTATASDPSKVTRSELLVDGAVAATSTGASLSWAWDSRTKADGTHRLAARVYETSGAEATSPEVSIITDNTTPSVTITSPSGSRVYKRNGGTWLAATASDLSGVTKVSFAVDGMRVYDDYSAPYSWYWGLGSVKRGWHRIAVTAFDPLGNQKSVSKRVYVR